MPASDCPDLLALPASARSIVDADRFGQLTACDTRRQAYGAGRRAILTHSPELHQAQAAGFEGTTLAKAGKKLDELAATLARGKTRRPRGKVESEITAITAKPWVRRVITWQLTGDQPRDFRLTWHVDAAARAALEEEIFGKHVLITGHDDWPAAEVIAGYRSQSEAEFAFRWPGSGALYGAEISPPSLNRFASGRMLNSWVLVCGYSSPVSGLGFAVPVRPAVN